MFRIACGVFACGRLLGIASNTGARKRARHVSPTQTFAKNLALQATRLLQEPQTESLPHRAGGGVDAELPIDAA